LLDETENCVFSESDVSDIDYVEESVHQTESEESCDEDKDECEPIVVTEEIRGNLIYLII
jgi:hypothetical protein